MCKFIGCNYDTEEDKDKILKTYDEYILNKLAFLNDTYSNKNTKLSYFTYYKNFFHEEEIIKGKDLMYFTTIEIKELLLSLINTKPSSRGAFLSFINNYLNYCVDKGYINHNQSVAINTKEIKKVSKRVIDVELINLKNFYEMVNEVYTKNSYNRVIIPILFARYGILGEECKDIMKLSFENVDKNNKLVKIIKNNREILLPIDNDFINWIDKLCDHDIGVILRNNRGLPIESKHTIYNMGYRFFQSLDKKRISLKELRENRKLDLLGDILSNQGYITMKDIEAIEQLIAYDNVSTSRTGVLKLKNLCMVIFGEENIRR